MQRRSFIASILAVLGIPISVKEIATSQETIVVVTLPEGYEDPSEELLAKIQQKLTDAFGSKVVVLPPGCQAKMLGGCYLREKLGDCEYEIAAQTEAGLLKLREQIKGG